MRSPNVESEGPVTLSGSSPLLNEYRIIAMVIKAKNKPAKEPAKTAIKMIL
jgi:hypothetical protein